MTSPPSVQGVSSSLRWDIQALRGWAIALVIIDHAKLPIFMGGFLGVDIFFVVSGFLMTGLIIRALDTGSFSLPGFYGRRARRLLPAAYSTIAITAIAAPFLLDPSEFHDFIVQAIGSFTFTVNYMLWTQIDYFNNLAALKPLLHMWSLSLEEQYYLFLPVLLLVCARRFRLTVSAMLTAGSLVLCYYMVQRSPSAAFYFLPTRAWELGIGSITAILLQGERLQLAEFYARPLRWASVLLVLVIPIIFSTVGHPGAGALMVCLATAWLMASPSKGDGGQWALPVWIGDRSYSLYLLHWPILAFANNIFISQPDIVTRVSLVVATVLAAEAQYRLVEKPFRQRTLSTSYLAVLTVLPLLIVGSLYGVQFATTGNTDDFRVANIGLSRACTFKNAFEPRPDCKTKALPTLIVWGDSFAMHIVPAVVSSTVQGVLQATQPICGPFIGIAAVDGQQFKESWAKQCIAFNDSVLDFIGKHPEIRTVALSSAFTQYFPSADHEWQLLKRDDHGFQLLPSDAPSVREGVKATIAALHTLGKRVVLFAPPPSASFDIGKCLDRKIGGYPMAPAGATCNFARADYQAYKREIIAFFADIEKTPGLVTVRFDDVICDSAQCHATIDGVPLYRDEAHLSVPGSIWLGQKLNLRNLLDH